MKETLSPRRVRSAPGSPRFRPNLTPVQAFQAGIFGGAYFVKETVLPGLFLKEAEGLLTHESIQRPEANRWGVLGGASLQWWEDRGLIHPDDPNGWFEWYTKWSYGRDHEDDSRQMSRWVSFIGRHTGGLRALQARGGDSPRTRQNLLQWAYEV